MRQQNVPTLHVNPTNLASGTGTSQCCSGRAQPQVLGSTSLIRFWIFLKSSPAGNFMLDKSTDMTIPAHSRTRPHVVSSRMVFFTGCSPITGSIGLVTVNTYHRLQVGQRTWAGFPNNSRGQERVKVIKQCVLIAYHKLTFHNTILSLFCHLNV